MTDPFNSRRRLLLAAWALPLARLARAADEDIDYKRTGGPYVPTPQIVVDEMLRLGRVGPEDFVVDLGSGDGVIVLTAATRLQASGLGVDIDPKLVRRSNEEARRRGVAGRASFRVEDVFKTDLSRATVVTLYLLPEMMLKLQPRIYFETRPGTRVVSHDYYFGEWEPDEEVTLIVPEKEYVNGIPRATVYLWVVPAKVAGRWRAEVGAPHARRFELVLKQSYQNVSGTATAAGAAPAALAYGRLEGDRIRFSFPEGRQRLVYEGRVDGNAMRGTVRLAGSSGPVGWTARRIV